MNKRVKQVIKGIVVLPLLIFPIGAICIMINELTTGDAFVIWATLIICGIMSAYHIYRGWRESVQLPNRPHTFVRFLKSIYDHFRMKYLLFDVRDSRELVLVLLHELGIPHEMQENQEDVFLEYNNRKYWIQLVNAEFIDILSILGTLTMDTLTRVEMEKFQETVNEFNYRCTLMSVYYEIVSNRNEIYVWGVLKTVFTKGIRNNKGLLVAYLDQFEEMSNFFGEQYHEKLREIGEKGRVVVKGFGPVMQEENQNETQTV